MQDRRDEFKDVPWQQGRLLPTTSVQRMPATWQDEARQQEARGLFAFFTPFDDGRRRERLWCFASADECAAAVEQHNRELAERNKT